MKKKITMFGSFAVDMMARTPHLPAAGETVRGNLFKQGAGGKGFNQAIAAHKAGADIALITKLGRDSLSKVATDAMDAVGLSKEHLFYHETEATGVALIMVDEHSSQNKIVIVPGACATIHDEDIKKAENCVKESAYLLLQLEVNQDANEKIAKLAKENGVRVVINTAPCQSVTDEFLSGAYLVTPNEVEAEALTGIAVMDLKSAERAACVFTDKGVQNVVITLGGRGVYLYTEGKSEIIPAYKVKAIDTTGAGDAFNGGLVAALAEGKDLHDAVRFANALAAISVQRLGTTPSMPSREEIDAFLEQHGTM